jgi:hypothetical protein
MEADATPGSPRHHSRPQGKRPGGPACHQAGLIFRPAGCLAFLFSGAAKRRSRNHFSGRGPVFCTPCTGGAIPVSTAAVPALSAVTALEIRPLTSPPAGRRQTSGGPLWRPGYTPGGWSNLLGELWHPCAVPVYKLVEVSATRGSTALVYCLINSSL